MYQPFTLFDYTLPYIEENKKIRLIEMFAG